jgi:hypothetical protein
MATVAEHGYEDAWNGLANAIRRIQPNCTPHDVARSILAYDTPGHTHLVGVTSAGNVLFYHCRDRYIVSIPIEVGGLADGGPVRADWHTGESPNIHQWVWKRRDWWVWVHPRYQWR